MKNGCKSGSSLEELLSRPAVELRLVGAEDKDADKDDPDADKDEDKDKKDDKSDKSNEGKDKTYTEAEWQRAQRKITALEEEKTKHYNLRKDAETELAELQTKFDKLEKDGMPSDAAKTALVKAEAERDKLKDKVEKLSLQVGFLTNAKHNWVDPKAALKLVDLDAVKYDDKTNTYVGLDKALDDLAKESPYLLKKADAAADDADKDANKDKKDKTPATRTGTPANNSKNNGDTKSEQAARAKLAQKYSGLRR